MPAFDLLLLGPDPFTPLPSLIAILLLADVGLAAVGALCRPSPWRRGARDLMVPLLLLPLLVPVRSPARRPRSPSSAARRRPTSRPMARLLALYDMVFVLVSIAVFDFLLED